MCSGPQPTSKRGTFVGEALLNEAVCLHHHRLVLDLEAFPPTRPGQFVQLQCRGLDELAGAKVVDWPQGAPPRFTQPELTDRETMLRRPLSLAGRRDHARGRAELDIIYRTVGVGTRWLTGVQPGDSLSLLGPLGNGFAIRPDPPAAALVGGGVGIPPMLYLAEALAAAGKRVAAFNGARSADMLPLRLLPSGHVSPAGEPTLCVAEFAAWDVPAAVATDDGSLGHAGLVTPPLERWLDAAAARPQDVVVYACGPEPMMRAVGEICIDREIECQLSLERHMACGMGTCQSCVVKIRDDTPRGWSFKLCCTDGPVFDAREVLW